MNLTQYFIESVSSAVSRKRVVVAELSHKFQVFVDVLAEVGENAHLASQVDVMRLYEIWLLTVSPRVAERLRKMGIDPCQGSLSRRQN